MNQAVHDDSRDSTDAPLINTLLRSVGDHHCVSNLSRVLPWYNVVSKCIKCIDIYYVVSTYTDVHNVATKTTISKR